MTRLALLASLLIATPAIAGGDYVAASTEYHEINSGVVTAAPFTVSLWFSVGDANPRNIWAAGDSGSDNNYFALQSLHGPEQVNISVRDTASSSVAVAATFGAWNHAAYQAFAVDSRYGWADGSKSGESGVSRTPAGVDYMAIGVRDGTTKAAPMEGKIAHVAIWSVALTDREIIELSRGVNPLTIRLESLVAYYPMDGDGPIGTRLRDVVGGNHMDVVGGTPTKTDSPPTVPGFTGVSYVPPVEAWSFVRLIRCREEDLCVSSC